MEYNHDRPVSDFKEDIDKLKSKGFNPIAVTQMYLEDTYVFETNEEATKAYHLFERDENNDWIGEMFGWWYGREEFMKTVEEYENNDDNLKVLIHWL